MEPLSDLIQSTRTWLDSLFERHPGLNRIRKEFSTYLADCGADQSTPRIVTGHQPVIYYPGLLFKDFFVGEAARMYGGSAWNFIVDTDMADMEVPVPWYAHGSFQKSYLALSNEQKKTFSRFDPPREERDDFFRSMGEHVTTLPQKEIDRAYRSWQKSFYKILEEKKGLVHGLTSMRKMFDHSLGYQIHDPRISDLVHSHAYWQYIRYLIQNLESYSAAYNRAVEQGKNGEYQPVKFLHQSDGWYELPFWLEREGNRLPVWIKKETSILTFRAGEGSSDIVVDTSRKEESSIIEELRDKMVLYPKATTLTQVLRLFLSDVFVHGSGAVEYEKINNLIMQEFFGMDQKLPFYSVTGDIYLPLEKDLPDFGELQNDYREKQKWLKEAGRNPEDLLENGLAQKYKARKKEIAQQMGQEEDPDKRKSLHDQLEGLNNEMKGQLSRQMERVRDQLARYDKLLTNKEVYYERQYPYFLYPGGYLTRQRFEANLRVKKHL